MRKRFSAPKSRSVIADVANQSITGETLCCAKAMLLGDRLRADSAHHLHDLVHSGCSIKGVTAWNQLPVVFRTGAGIRTESLHASENAHVSAPRLSVL